jgi:long-chain acyl-CoA synthetase
MEIKRLFDVSHYQLANFPLEKSIGGKTPSGEWKYYSTKEVIDLANKVSLGLLKLGVQPGDKIAQGVYQNRPEWVIMDIGIQQIGAINVPVYPTISPSEYEYIFNDAGVKHCFVGVNDLYDKVLAAKPNVPSLQNIYTFDKQEGRPFWEDMFVESDDLSEVQARMADVKPDQLATLIYTSGTTGNPKGVMLSHNNIISNVQMVKEIMPIGKNQIALSFLPLCHIFERAALYAYMQLGINIVFTGTANLGGDDGDLKAIKPHFFTTVPRLLEKVYEKIYSKGLDLTGVKKKLFFWALDLTNDYEYDKEYTGLAKIQRNVADKLIFSKWREALGGRVVGILTGAAPCPMKMAKIFSAAGIPIREGYGLTETSPGLTINSYAKRGARLGTVGPVLNGVTIKIDPSDGDYKEGEGEILAKGPNVMMGYYNKPEKTAEVMSADGWFHTGDIGKFVSNEHGDKYLKITDRKKELLKTSGGKYVAPAPVENKFKEEFLIEQMMVIGDKRKFVSALICPAANALKDWCDENGVSCTLTPMEKNPTLFKISEDTLTNPKVLAKFQAVIDDFNPLFSHIEQVKKFKLLPEPWDVSTEELTPTLKLKRRVIREKYGHVIDSIYAVA